jgi:hypothetical protein
MTGFAFINKDCGNVDCIVSWAELDELPNDYPIQPNQQVIKIENYNNDYRNYESYDLVNNTFNKRLTVTTDKFRTLLGSAINIKIDYPISVNEIVHLIIGSTTQDVYVVNGTVTFSYTTQELGGIQIIAKSSSIYGLNYAGIEVLN